MDSTLHERVHRNQARRQEILFEIAGLRKRREVPIAIMGKEYVHVFCSRLSKKLNDRESNFGKEYMRLLVDEIKVKGQNVYHKGSYAALMGAIQQPKLVHSCGVPSFGSGWLRGTYNCKNFSSTVLYQWKRSLSAS